MQMRSELIKKSSPFKLITAPRLRGTRPVLLLYILPLLIHLAQSRCIAGTHDNTLTEAFHTGLGSAETPLETTTRNGTLVLKAAGIEKTCHLCTPVMQRHTAMNLGTATALARSSDSPVVLELRHFSDSDVAWVDGIMLPAHVNSVELTPRSHLVVIQRNHISGGLTIPAQSRPHVSITPSDLSFSHLYTERLRAGLLLAAFGTALSSIGGAFFMLHGDCATTKVNASGECDAMHHLKPNGIVFVAAGATLLGAGIGLIVHRQRLLRSARKRFMKGRHWKEVTE
ncbi:MAG: hypothetical protein JXX14_20690 [Deltaproteobacteria bacterium]|nr:hypothetical protein [Deltaproteobacteria bacterium]